MRWVLLTVLVVLAAGATGCMTAASQAYSTVTGASPRFYELQDVGGPAVLDGYPSAAVAPFDPSPMLGAIPPEVPAETQRATIAQLEKSKLFAGVGAQPAARPALLVRGKFMDYDPGGTPLRVVGFAGNPFLTAQVELVDAGTGKVLGVAMCTGTIKSVARTGVSQLAEGVAKAVEGWLKHHHSKPPKE